MSFYVYVYHPTFNVVNNFVGDSFITHRHHRIYEFTISVLLALLQIRSAGNATSSFQIHPVTTTACVLGILAYYLAFRGRQRFPLYANKTMAVFGSFFLASLVTLLVPDSWWRIEYIFYALFAVVELHQVVTVLYDNYVRRSLLTTRRSWPPDPTRHLLPLTYMDLREQ